MRIELGSQKLPPNIIPEDYESQLVRALAIIVQSILGRSNTLIAPLKYQVFGGFHQKSLLGRTEMRTRDMKDRHFILTV